MLMLEYKVKAIHARYLSNACLSCRVCLTRFLIGRSDFMLQRGYRYLHTSSAFASTTLDQVGLRYKKLGIISSMGYYPLP